MKKPTAKCPLCGKMCTVSVPKGGDGSAYVTRWHKAINGAGMKVDCRAEVDCMDVNFPAMEAKP